MQKGDVAKLKLLLSGISARLTKNRDFFVQADCMFTSGKKKFDARLTRTEQGYQLRFQGSAREVDADGFCAFFAEQAEKFDEYVFGEYRTQRSRDPVGHRARRADEAG